MKLKFDFSWNWIWFCLFAIGFGIFFMATPKYLDDYWYMEHTYDWFERQGIWNPDEGGNPFVYGLPWEGLEEIIRYHYLTDTTRICNIIGTFAILLPKWLCSLPALIALLYTVYGCFKLADVDMRRSWLVGIGLSLWVITPLWYHVMGTMIFQYNYVLSGALCVGLLLMIKNAMQGNPPRMVWFILLTLLVAVWHEGFTLPMLAGLIAVAACFRDCRNKWIYVAILILTVGMAWHLLSVATLERSEQIGYFGFNPKRIIRSLWYHRAMWLLGLVSIIFMIRKGWRRYFSDRLFIFSLTSVCVAIGLVYITSIERAAWWGDMAAVIMTLSMLRQLNSGLRGYKGWRGWVAAPLMLWSGFQLAAADVFAVRYAREYPKIVRDFLNEPGTTYFSELADYPWIGIWFMQFNDNYKFIHPEFPKQFYWGLDNEHNFLTIMPAGLSHIEMSKLKPLDGDMGLYRYGPYMVAPTDSIDNYWLKHVDLDYGWFKVRDRYILCMPFTSAADGRRYIYAMPKYNLTEYEFGNLKGATQGEEIPDR